MNLSAYPSPIFSNLFTTSKIQSMQNRDEIRLVGDIKYLTFTIITFNIPLTTFFIKDNFLNVNTLN